MPEPDYFTLATFRLLPDMSNLTKYPDLLVLDAAAYITSIIEREVGTSFIERNVAGELHDGGSDGIPLLNPYVRSVTAVTEDGVAVTDTLRARSGVLRRYSAGSSTPGYWASGVENISVTYVSGYSATPPGDITSAAMQGTRARLIETASSATISDRRTSMTNEMGTINFVIAGGDNPTGYPSVDAVIVGWREKLDVFGFA